MFVQTAPWESQFFPLNLNRNKNKLGLAVWAFFIARKVIKHAMWSWKPATAVLFSCVSLNGQKKMQEQHRKRSLLHSCWFHYTRSEWFVCHRCKTAWIYSCCCWCWCSWFLCCTLSSNVEHKMFLECNLLSLYVYGYTEDWSQSVLRTSSSPHQMAVLVQI